MTSLPFDRVAHEYDETRGGEPRGRAMAASMRPYFARDGRTLEVGVGTGVVAMGLRELGRDVVGVDLSEPMLRYAHARRVPVARADAMRLPVRDGSVDDVYAVWVLHLVGDIGATLGELARVLRPGGRCLVGVPNPYPDETEDEVDRLFRRLWDTVRGRRPDHPDAVRRLAGERGLRFVELARVDAGEYRQAPAEVARRIERRTYSYLWDISDERWRELVVPAIEALRAMPDPEVERVKRDPALLVVLEKS